MNKVQVGNTPSPNIKAVRSKIGSLENATYKPGGGKVKIENRKLEFGNVTPKIAAKNNAYTPSGGTKKVHYHPVIWILFFNIEFASQNLPRNKESEVRILLLNATMKTYLTLWLSDHNHKIGMEREVKGGFTAEHVLQAWWRRQEDRDRKVGLQG